MAAPRSTNRKVALTDAEADFLEAWESVTESTQYVIKIDFRGEEYQEMVAPGREFEITTEERLVTEKRIVDAVNNPFKNGRFRPVRVPEEITVETNPNALSAEDISRIFRSSSMAWEEYLDVIDGEETLRRMIEFAQDSDDLSVKRLNQLQERFEQVKPKRRVTSKALDDFEKADESSEKKRTRSSGRATRSTSTVQ